MDANNFHYKNNRLQQLRGFYYTVLKGSVVKAAEHLGLTQSTVSAQIASLERDLGAKLFDRVGKYLEPNKNGKLLYKMSVPSIQSLDYIFEDFLEESQNKRTYLDISGNQSSILYLLPEILKKYRDKYPEINLMIRNLSREEGLKRLLNNETDLCFYPYTEVPDECDFYHVADFDPVLVLRKDHPLAAKQNIKLEDVAAYDLVRIDPHLITLPMFEEVVRKYKLGSNIKFEMGDWEILKKMVIANIGVAIISNICIDKNDTELIGIPLPGYFPQMPYGVCAKKGHLTEAVQNFIDLINQPSPSCTAVD